MTPDALATEIAVWTDARHAPLAAQVLDLLGGLVQPIAVGSADGQLADWARTLDAPTFRDLRKLRVDRPAAFLFAATASPPNPDDLRDLAADGTTVLLLQPPADDAKTLDRLAAPDVAKRLVRTPRFDACPGLMAAADPEQAFQNNAPHEPHRPAFLHLTSHGPPTHGSLFARAFDAWRTALRFVPLPETIDATLHKPQARPAAKRPAELTGRLAVHARSADGSAVTFQLSDHALTTQRRLRVTADHADLEATDGRYQLLTQNPNQPQQPPHTEDNTPPDASPPLDHPPFADLIAGHFRRLLDRPPLPNNPAADRSALACVRACQLSAKTGQPERPDQMLFAGL